MKRKQGKFTQSRTRMALIPQACPWKPLFSQKRTPLQVAISVSKGIYRNWLLQGLVWGEGEETYFCAVVLFTVWPHKWQCTSLKCWYDVPATASQVLPLLPAVYVLHICTTGFKFKWRHCMGVNKWDYLKSKIEDIPADTVVVFPLSSPLWQRGFLAGAFSEAITLK